MVTNGEDSLNEHTEDEGFIEPGGEEPIIGNDRTLEDLRAKLGRSTQRITPIENEPTREQLIATGEADSEEDDDSIDEDAGEKDDSSQGNGGKPSTDVAIPKPTTSIRKQIEEALMAGETREELIARGFNKKSVQTVASELKAKMGARNSIGRQPTTQRGTAIFAKGSPPEAIIDAIEVPDVAAGEGVPFEQGLKFGMSLVILGVRVAQELSGIGVTQAKPILEMAKSMREGEAVAAKNAAGEAASEAAGMVSDQLLPILQNLSMRESGSGGGGGGGGSADPMRAMFAKSMAPMFQQLMQGAMGTVMKMLPGAAAAPGAPQITPGKTTPEASAPQGWKRREE